MTYVETDAAGRVTLFRRGPAMTPIMESTYTYFDNNQLDTVSHVNGAYTSYTYDHAERVTAIEHFGPGPVLRLMLEYTYTSDNLPATITESDSISTLAVVSFTYDYRNRLVEEERTGTGAYHLEYTYDAGGNRLEKIDHANDRRTDYVYDVSDPATYGSDNNRLMKYEVYDTSGSPAVLLSTVYYHYNSSGNPKRIITEQASAPGEFSAVRFGYASNGQASIRQSIHHKISAARPATAQIRYKASASLF